MADNFFLVLGPSGDSSYVDVEDYATSPIVNSAGAASGTVQGYGRQRVRIGGAARNALADVLNALPLITAYGLPVRPVPSGTAHVFASGYGLGGLASGTVSLTAISATACATDISATCAGGGGTIEINSDPVITLPPFGAFSQHFEPGTLLGATIVFTGLDSYYVAGVE